jgi:hypothetical protein
MKTLHGEKCLTATGAAANQGWPALGEPSLRDFIEPPDARRAFFQNINRLFYFSHHHLPLLLMRLYSPIKEPSFTKTVTCAKAHYASSVPSSGTRTLLILATLPQRDIFF